MPSSCLSSGVSDFGFCCVSAFLQHLWSFGVLLWASGRVEFLRWSQAACCRLFTAACLLRPGHLGCHYPVNAVIKWVLRQGEDVYESARQSQVQTQETLTWNFSVTKVFVLAIMNSFYIHPCCAPTGEKFSLSLSVKMIFKVSLHYF